MAEIPQKTLVVFQFHSTRLAVDAEAVDRIGNVPSPIPEQLEVYALHSLLGVPDYVYREPRLLYLKQQGRALMIDQLEDIQAAAPGSIFPLPRLIIRLASVDYAGWTAAEGNEVMLILDISGIIRGT